MRVLLLLIVISTSLISLGQHEAWIYSVPGQAKEIVTAYNDDTISVILDPNMDEYQLNQLDRLLAILPYPFKYEMRIKENGLSIITTLDTSMVFKGFKNIRKIRTDLSYSIIATDSGRQHAIVKDVDGQHMQRLAQEIRAKVKGNYHINVQSDLVSAFPYGNRRFQLTTHLVLSRQWSLSMAYEYHKGYYLNLRNDSLDGKASQIQVFRIGTRFYPAKRFDDAPEWLYLKASGFYMLYTPKNETTSSSLGFSMGAGCRFNIKERFYLEYGFQGSHVINKANTEYMPKFYTRVPKQFGLKFELSLGLRFGAWK